MFCVALIATVQALVAKAVEKNAALQGRLERAVTLLLFRELVLDREANCWAVQSERDPQVFYRVKSKVNDFDGLGPCECVDFQEQRAPNGWCKHRLAIRLLIRGTEEERATKPKRRRTSAA